MRTTTFRRLMLPLAAAAALTLGACGDDSSNDSGPVGDGNGSAAETVYLQSLQSAGLDIGDPAALIGEGKQVCADLEAGQTMNDLIDVSSADPVRRATIVGSAVGAFCPEQQENVVPDVPDGTGN